MSQQQPLLTKQLVANVADFAEKKQVMVNIKGMEVGVFAVNGKYYAWRNMCPHAAAPVCKGRVCGTKLPSNVYEYILGREGEILRCPWHGWEFDLTTGEHLVDGSVRLRGYEVCVEGDQVYLLVK